MQMPIPKEMALQLCAKIRQENHHKRYTWQRWMCWGCETFSKGDPDRMCVSSRPDYRGCVQVNARYDHLSQVTN